MLAMVSVMTMAAQDSKVLFDNADAPMLSWSVACQVSADDVKGIKAGDVIEVTVSDVKADCAWPKFGFEANGQSNYPGVFEMWTRRDNLPYVGKYIVTDNDLSLLSGGFEIKGDGVKITKVVFVGTVAEVLPSDQTLIYNNPDAAMLSWSVACVVTPSQVGSLKAGDAFQVTVNAVKEGCEWPKFGFEWDGKSIYPEAFEMWGGKTFPYVATYYVTAEEAASLKDGFEIKGDGVQITRMVLVSATGSDDGTTVLWSGVPTQVSWGDAGPSVAAGKAAGIEVGDQIIVTVSEISSSCEWPKVVCRSENGWEEIFTLELWNDSKDAMPLEKSVIVSTEMLPLMSAGFNFGGEGASIEKVTLSKSTGVVVATFTQDKVSVFSVSGVCVRNNVSAADALIDLPAGLYIVGGKKVIVK